MTELVLVVDNNDVVRRAHERALTRAGFHVDAVKKGRVAFERMSTTEYSAVVTDIAMPELDGIDFLRAVREVNFDLPVILVTGAPELATPASEVDYGAFRFLAKPVPLDILVGAVRRAARLYDWGKLRWASSLGRHGSDVGDRAAVDAGLTRALNSLWTAYQPIVSLTKEIFAYKAPMRTNGASLPNPVAVLDVSAS